MRANTTVKIKKMDVKPFAEATEGPQLKTGNFISSYEGELEGEGILQELWIFHSESYAEVYGLERMNATLEGKKGTYVTEHKGRLKNGILTKTINVIPGSGTGELTGLGGGIDVETVSADEFHFVFDYNFE